MNRTWAGWASAAAIVLGATAFAACDGDDSSDWPTSAASDAPGIRFDPATVRPGDSVGALVVDSLAAESTLVDSTLVGTARFRGEIELSGRIIAHPDDDLRVTELCFEADSVSAARLPRWAGDERRPWFCFTNIAGAVEVLGEPASGRTVTVVVEDYTIHRRFSDAVNGARLVRSGS